jgi:hypothetical protein
MNDSQRDSWKARGFAMNRLHYCQVESSLKLVKQQPLILDLTADRGLFNMDD